MKKWFQNHMGEMVSFFLCLLIITLLFKMVGIFNHTVLISDLLYAFYPFYTYLSRFLLGEVGLFSLTLGMGSSFLGTLYFYMMSPFNLLLYWIKDINTFCIITIMLKSAFSSVFCYRYLRYQFSKEKRLIFISFSLLYALSSYYLSYNMHVEFLDIYMLFPLVLLGIDKILKEKNYKLYTITFLLIIFCNYYFAYMVLIFGFFYYNYKLLLHRIPLKKIVKKNIPFFIVSFLACLTMSFIFLPVLSEIGTYSRGSSAIFGGKPFQIIFHLQDIVNHYLIGNFINISVLNPKHFYLYTSIVVVPLLYFYYLNPKFSKREKVLTGIFLLILILSISCNYVNYMWHGFTPPLSINGRFTFMFILWILMICVKSLYHLKTYPLPHYFYLLAFFYFAVFSYTILYYPRAVDVFVVLRFFGLYYLSSFLSLQLKKHFVGWKIFFIGFFLITILYFLLSLILQSFSLSVFKIIYLPYLCIFLFYLLIQRREISMKHFFILSLFIFIPFSLYSIFSNYLIVGKFTFIKYLILIGFVVLLYYLPKKKFVKWIFFVLILIEIFINGYHYLYRFSYHVDLDHSIEKVIDTIQEKDSSLFYRVEDNDQYVSINNTVLYQYYGISYFISTIKTDFIQFFVDLGIKDKNDNFNSVQFNGSYHIIASLLGVKYFVDLYQKEIPVYQKIDMVGNSTIYYNEDALSLGYLVDSQIKDLKKSGNGLDYTNDIYKAMTKHEEDLFEKIEVSREGTSYTFFNTSSSSHIYFLFEEDIDSPLIYVNDVLLEDLYYNGVYFIKNDYEIGEKITIRLDSDVSTNLSLYYYRDEVYQEDIEILKENQLEITKIGNHIIEGEMDSNREGVLFLSCCDDPSLQIYVDGKKQEKIKLLNTFIGTDLKKGKHKIKIVYQPKVLYISFLPSVIGFILLLFYLRKMKTK